MLQSSNFNSFNRGPLLVLGFILLFIGNSKGGNSIPCNDSIIKSGLSSIDPTINSAVSHNHIYYFTPELIKTKEGLIQIRKLDPISGHIFNLYCKLPKSLNVTGSTQFAINGKYLVMQDEMSLELSLFEFHKDTFQFKSKIEFPERTKFFDLYAMDDEQFLFTDIYNHHPNENKFNVSLAIFDPAKNNFINVIHPTLPCIAWSHFPKNWVAISSEQIIVAQPCGNKLLVYNHRLNYEKTIEFKEPESWKDLVGDSFPIQTSLDKIHPKILIEELRKFQYSMNRIEEIKICNDSILFVRCTFADSILPEKRMVFIYNFNKNKFCTGSITYSMTSLLQKEPSMERSLNIIFNTSLCTKGQCLIINNDSFIPLSPLNPTDCILQRNIYYEKHEPEFIFERYGIDWINANWLQ